MSACKDCAAFNAIAGRPDVGHCRRYPPQMVGYVPGVSRMISDWPEVNHDDWCREFEAVEGK